MNATCYNLIWVSPLVEKLESRCVFHGMDELDPTIQNLDINTGIDAIILYPSLLTPAIVVGQEKLEVLLLVKDGEPDLKEFDVNRQLKVAPDIDPKKPYTNELLLKEGVLCDCIKVAKVTEKRPVKFEKASFYIDPRAEKRYKNNGYSQLYKVVVPFHEISHSPPDRYLNDGQQITPREVQDKVIWRRIFDLNGKKIERQGLYSFKVSSKDIAAGEIDITRPVQSFHPVFHYQSKEVFNLFVLGDVHASARHQVLKHSNARVIETDDPKHQNLSPEIGKLMNCSSANFIDLLNQAGKENDVDLIWLMGDFVDYIKNVYPTKEFLKKVEDKEAINKAKVVWDMVALDDSYQERYQDYVDYVGVFSIIVDFYMRYKKPIFGVTGNHDCYYQPWGISPRVGPAKANAGIPADHNLTIFEASLVFGETYGELKKGKGNFDKNNIEWYSLVLTPFSDFSVVLPTQVMVGLGWGDREDLVMDTRDTGQGLGGHLPRAPDAISSEQLALINDAVAKNKKVILASHFTVVSFKEDVPENFYDEGDIDCYDNSKRFTKYSMGTFETNKRSTYVEHLKKKKDIQCVLTGHSHRRAAYEITDRKAKVYTNAFVYSRMHAFENYSSNTFEPVIVVTDSVGPLPRRNVLGEFNGWGSDVASGTKVIFQKIWLDPKTESVKIHSIERIGSVVETAKPRIAVAIDYFDFVGFFYDIANKVCADFSKRAIKEFKSEILEEEVLRYGSVPETKFAIELNEYLVKWGIGIREMWISIFLDNKWNHIKFSRESANVFSIRSIDGRILYRCSNEKENKVPKYLSIFFERIKGNSEENTIDDHLSSYSFEHSWNLEVNLKFKKFSTEAGNLFIERNLKDREDPNFKKRKKFYNKYQ